MSGAAISGFLDSHNRTKGASFPKLDSSHRERRSYFGIKRLHNSPHDTKQLELRYEVSLM